MQGLEQHPERDSDQERTTNSPSETAVANDQPVDSAAEQREPTVEPETEVTLEAEAETEPKAEAEFEPEAEVEPETEGEPEAEAEPGTNSDWWAGEATAAKPSLKPKLPQTEPFDVKAAHSASEDDGTRQLDSSSAPTVRRHRSVQGLAASAIRDVGRVREMNQDSVYAMITSLPRESHDINIGLFIIADGMGGHTGGDIASRLAIETVVVQILEQLVLPAFDDQVTEALQPMMITAIQEANRVIYERSRADGNDMGTTCTAALLIGSSLYIAHVGDSRCYLYQPGGIKQLTTDHSTVGRLIQLGHLDPAEVKDHPLRNQLYRTVGQQANIHVDFVYQPIGNASHLLLCSDGLWGMVDVLQIEQALGRSLWPEDASNELIALANLAGGEDNIGVVVVTLPIAER